LEAQTVDVAKSEIKWTGYGVGKSHWGHVNIKDAEVNLKDGKPHTANIVVDMNSIASKDLDDASMAARLNGHLKSEDFFEVEKYPLASFTATKISVTKNGTYTLEGNLTIKDQTHPETFVLNKIT